MSHYTNATGTTHAYLEEKQHTSRKRPFLLEVYTNVKQTFFGWFKNKNGAERKLVRMGLALCLS